MSDAGMDLRELYQDIILDHGRHPRNFRALEPESTVPPVGDTESQDPPELVLAAAVNCNAVPAAPELPTVSVWLAGLGPW